MPDDHASPPADATTATASSSPAGGRPPLLPEQRRSCRVWLALGDEHRANVTDAAQRAGEATTTYAQRLVVERMDAHRLRPSLEEDDLEAVRRLALALNRAVHRLHVLGAAQPEPLGMADVAAEVEPVLGPLADALSAARQRLAGAAEDSP
jgi:hypothetical protein